MYEIAVKSQFSAAHTLPGHPGKCSRLHGHTWVIEVLFSSAETGEDGMVLDFEEARGALERVLERFDHSCLNDIAPFDRIPPTAENVARVIFEHMSGDPEDRRAVPTAVTVWETRDARATYRAR